MAIEKEIIDELIKQLNHKWKTKRYEAAWELGFYEFEAKNAVPYLIKKMNDQNEDYDVRYESIISLGEICTKKAISSLIKIANKKDSDVRHVAIRSLGYTNLDEAVDELIYLLREDEDAYIRATACEALGYTENKNIIKWIIESYTHDTDYSVRQKAAEILGRFGINAKNAIPFIIEKFKDMDEENSVLEESILTLGKIKLKSQEISSLLLEIIKNSDNWRLRKNAATSLGNLEIIEAIEPLLDIFCNDSSAYVRGRAVEALGKIALSPPIIDLITRGEHEIIDELIKRLVKEDSSYVYTKIVDTISNISSELKLEYDDFIDQYLFLKKEKPENIDITTKEYGAFSGLNKNQAHIMISSLIMHLINNLSDKEEFPINDFYTNYNINKEIIISIIKELINDNNIQGYFKDKKCQIFIVNKLETKSTIKDVTKPYKILFIGANPEGDLRQGREFSVIKKHLEENNDFEIVLPEFGATGSSLRKALLKYKPHFLHISCHGTIEGSLIFENEHYELQEEFSGENLVDLLKIYNEHFKTLKLVILSACDSKTFSTNLINFIDFVISMDGEITESAAIDFADAFYESLNYGSNIIGGYKFGILALKANYDDQYLIPIIETTLK